MVKIINDYLPEWASCANNPAVKYGGYCGNITYKLWTNKLTQTVVLLYMSRLMGKPTICIGENKGADQLRGNREADQRLCFRYSDSTIPLLLKSEISSF